MPTIRLLFFLKYSKNQIQAKSTSNWVGFVFVFPYFAKFIDEVTDIDLACIGIFRCRSSVTLIILDLAYFFFARVGYGPSVTIFESIQGREEKVV